MFPYNSFLILRPHWDENTSPDALQQAERDSFLEWRRALAQCVIFYKIYLIKYKHECKIYIIFLVSQIIVQFLQGLSVTQIVYDM